jgi:hypothetical protein
VLSLNNHFSAKSVANAAMIKRRLGEPIEGGIRSSSSNTSELTGAVNVHRAQVGGCFRRQV